MGKLSAKARDALLESGTLTPASVEELQKDGHISKAKQVVKKFIKTADGKWVEPKLYFRGGKNVQKSKKMESFISDYNNLLNKYTTTRNNK
jgi:hypothetical protein|tara:strand:- start:655 stop:927 length:273 start_codon:yes stop_codon:yes gene_type:complete